ncbi:MAG: colicin production protein CvpA [Caulobacteraceae bacterium]|nr:colicin production protein CvpA [Caulobacteraceae bacterium]
MFDLIVLLILGVSALIGFFRGALREVVTVVAFVVAVLVAVVASRLTAPIFRHVIHVDWLATALAILVVFLAVYIALRLIGGHFTEKVRKTHLGALDRAGGVAFGLIRALVTLGLFNILFHIATPPERTPKWVTQARLYPLTEVSADALRAIAPRGSALASRVAPALKDAVGDGGKGDNAPNQSYEARDRKAMNDLLEKSR